MFAERFDALMNIAEVSNSKLGRHIHINPSHIGRLRSGARPLPKKHEYLLDICHYLTGHIKKEYQITALQKLTGIENTILASPKSTALYLEQWLLALEQDTSSAAERLISGFSRIASRTTLFSSDDTAWKAPQKYAAYLYGNAGKRKAVEQFFYVILQEKKPQTLLLFSDENMAWLYEDAAFAARWTELFTKVLLKGNRVKIIHMTSRNMNEMLEAVTKWIPIYLTGMIEPYYYPRLKDGIFQHTMFIAPETAAVVSSSVQQNTDGMLNFFLTDRAALSALQTEFDHYFALCRPLVCVFTEKDADAFHRNAKCLFAAEGNAWLCSAMPPLFTMPEKLLREISEKNGYEQLITEWRHTLNLFRKNIKEQHLSLILLNPESAFLMPNLFCPSVGKLLFGRHFSYTKEQYLLHIDWLKQMEKRHENLNIRFVNEIADNTLIYVKEDKGVIMSKTNPPETAFVINDRNMVNAFRDYIEKKLLI